MMMTFGTLLDRYLESLAGRPSQLDYQQLRQQFFTTPEWADKPAAAVTRYDVLMLALQLGDRLQRLFFDVCILRFVKCVGAGLSFYHHVSEAK